MAVDQAPIGMLVYRRQFRSVMAVKRRVGAGLVASRDLAEAEKRGEPPPSKVTSELTEERIEDWRFEIAD
jgi:hypothetical protein